jgi:hypothetical protein
VHGVTGYLADTFEELCAYLQPKHLAKLNRQACRDHVAQNFTMKALAQQYLALYHDALAEVAQPGSATTVPTLPRYLASIKL